MVGRRVQGVLAMPLLLVAVACAGEGDGDELGSLGGGGGGDGIAALLAALPASDGSAGSDESDGSDPLVVAYGDLQRAAEVAGVERPSDPGDTEALRRYLNGLSGILADGRDDAPRPSVAVAWPDAASIPQAVQIDEFVEDVGWNILEVDRYIERQTPPDRVTILDGRFDRDRIDEALGEADDGVWIAGNPEGFDVEDVTPARPIGQPLWLSLDDDRLRVSGTAESLDAARDAGEASGTLADDTTLASLAQALDGEDVFSAILLGGYPGGMIGSAPALTPEQAEELCEQTLAVAPLGVGVGLADDDGPVVVMAYAHGSEGDAQANAEAVERLVEEGSSALQDEPWSESLAVDDVAVDGTTTVARVRPTENVPVGIWIQILQVRDNLVAAC
jgi:hypothetical protein